MWWEKKQQARTTFTSEPVPDFRYPGFWMGDFNVAK
jgi:hypothetical protein